MPTPIYNHIVKRTSRYVITPKTVQRAYSAVSKATPKQSKTKQVAVQSYIKQPNIIRPPSESPVRVRPRVGAIRQRDVPIKAQRGPKVTYIKQDISEESKKRIRGLKDSGIGKILVVIGNGPSVLNVDLQRLKGHPEIDIMSINKPDDRVWPTKYWLFCDRSQHKRNIEKWNNYNGILINTPSIPVKSNTVHVANLTNRAGFSRNLVDGFFLGKSSVFCSMQVAKWMNYDHIYIFGCDMNTVNVNGKEMLHFYGSNPDVVQANRIKRFAEEAKSYDHAASVLSDSERERYTFCSSHNKFAFVNKFNRLDEKEAVDIILTAIL